MSTTYYAHIIQNIKLVQFWNLIYLICKSQIIVVYYRIIEIFATSNTNSDLSCKSIISDEKNAFLLPLTLPFFFSYIMYRYLCSILNN